MQDLSAGDSSSKPSSPRPTPQTTRGRGRPTGDNIRIPWQVLELTGAGGGCSSTGVPVGDQVKKPEDPNRSEESSGRLLVSHKRKHSQVIAQPQAVSPTKSHVQQEAPYNDESSASGDDDAVKKQSSDDVVAAQENSQIIMEPSAAAAAVVSEKGGNEASVEEKNEEADIVVAEDIESFEAVEEKNEEDDSSDDDAVTSELNKVMEAFESAEEKNEDEPSADAGGGADNGGKCKEVIFETAAEEKNVQELLPSTDKNKEAIIETAEEKHEEKAESSDAAEKRMKFLFDLNELPSVEEDDEEEDKMP